MKDLVMRVGFRATELAYTHPLTTPPPLCFSFHISHHHHHHHLLLVAHNSRSNGGGAAPRSSSMIHFDVLDGDDHGVDDDGPASPRSSSTVALPAELLAALDDGDDDDDDGGDGDGDGEDDDQDDGQMMMPPIAKQLLVFAKLYMVIFRSRRSESADDELLYSADADAKHEAIASGGLLLYWYGNMNERRECLATCIWRSRDDALRAMKLPKHMLAAKLAHRMYDSYQLDKYWLIVSASRVCFRKIESVASHRQSDLASFAIAS